MSQPRLLVTLGDVAGIGPEIVARAWPELVKRARPVVVGDVAWLERGLRLVGSAATVQAISEVEQARSTEDVIPCLPGSSTGLRAVDVGRVSAAAGKAAYDFLCRAIDLTMDGTADGIVTCPLQ